MTTSEMTAQEARDEFVDWIWDSAERSMALVFPSRATIRRHLDLVDQAIRRESAIEPTSITTLASRETR